MEIFDVLNSLMAASKGDEVLGPIYGGITLVGPYAIAVVAALSIFYGVFLGVKYAKCQTVEEKMNAQKTLINFIIGAVIVLTLISILYAIRGPLAAFIES